MRLRRDSGRSQVIEETRREAPPKVANVGFHLLEPVAQSKRYAITNVDSLGVIERFTFAEVVRETARWAALLRANGLQPGDRVLVLAGREWGWRCALLGAIRAGGVAVPCPPSLPLQEVRAVASDADASLLVSLRTRPDLAELDGLPALSEDDLDAVDASEALRQPPHATDSRDIALILYSWRGLDLTGTMHTHASLLAQAETADDWLGVAGEERIWSTVGEGSSPSIWLLLAALRRAASIVIVDLELEPEGTLELLDRLRPAAVWFSDEEYAALGSAEIPPWVDLRSIRRALLTDAAAEGATAFASAFGTAVTPVFGVDELGVVAGWSAGSEPAAAAGRARPVAGVHVAVHADDQEELPPGEIGDVVVRGDAPSLFTGYTGREHGRSRSATWFRLGWRGSLTGDGTLELVDRSPSEVEPAVPTVESPAPEVAEEAHPEPEPVEMHDEAEAEARRRAEEEREAEERRVREEAEARERAEREAAEAAEALRLAEQEATARAAAEAEARRAEEDARQRAEDEERREEERRREEDEAREREAREAKERAAAEAEERRRAEEEAKQRAEDEKRREKERERNEKERVKREAEERRRAEEEAKARAQRAEAEAKEREKQEVEDRRRAEEEAKAQAKRAEAEAKEREKQEAEDRRRAAEEAKVQAKIAEAEAKERAKREAEERRRAEEEAKAQAKRAEAEAKQREKQEAEDRRRAAEQAKAQAKIAEAEAKQRAKDEKRLEKERSREDKERERREAEEAKVREKIAAAEAKERAEEEKRRERERAREEREAGRRADKEAKNATRAARKEKRSEPKPAPSDEGRRLLGRRRREEIVEEPEREHVEIDVVARIRQYGMAAASEAPPAVPPEEQEEEQQARERQPSTD